MLRFLLLTLLFALLALQVEAATYYVDGARGDDAGRGSR